MGRSGWPGGQGGIAGGMRGAPSGRGVAIISGGPGRRPAGGTGRGVAMTSGGPPAPTFGCGKAGRWFRTIWLNGSPRGPGGAATG